MTDASELRETALDPAAWRAAGLEIRPAVYRGRPCLRFADAFATLILPEIDVADGLLELDLAVGRERSFHGLVWHARDAANHESFFVRPHQVGNPDAIQYTPVTNGISSWQLYHGEGFWAPVTYPIEDWFTIRVAFAGSRAEVWVGDLTTPAVRISELKHGAGSGGIGLLLGGPGLRVARFAYGDTAPALDAPMAPSVTRQPGVIRAWQLSDAFAEADIAGLVELPPDLVSGRSWRSFDAEPGGLLDLARANGIEGGRNTVLARTTIRAGHAVRVPLELGFSDRAVVFLNGLALFRGDDTYRSRDYRFLGSIGYWDTIHLPLGAGDNELVVAVSEDFGGWGLQARLAQSAAASAGVSTT